MKMVDCIYVCHYTRLTDRKKYLTRLLDNLGDIPQVVWIEEHDKENITTDIIDEFPNINKKLKLGDFTKNDFHENRTLRMSEISLLLKHRHAWCHTISNKFKNVLVIEDDVLFVNDFISKFDNQISQTPDNYDIVWVGGSFNWHGDDITPNIYLYPGPRARCTHSYMISNNCCRKMINHFDDNYYPVDFMFDEAIKKYHLNSFWMEPELMFQDHNRWSTTIQNDHDFILPPS